MDCSDIDINFKLLIFSSVNISLEGGVLWIGN